MTTPNFTPDVPQWNEPMRYDIPYSNGCAGCPRLFIGTRWIGEICGAIYLGHDSEKYAARIVSLWNEAIVTPAPAATDAGEVRYACSKLAALGDTVKFLRIDDGLRLKVVKVRDDGMCELEYFDGGFFDSVDANQLEFVPEIPPATTPKYDGLPEFPTPAQRIDDALPYFREWLTNPEGTDGCYMECLHSGEIVAHFSDMNDALAFQAMAAAYEKAIGLLERVESPPDMNWFKELWSLTGEHMVLTEEGWIPAECNTREHTGSDPADVLDEVNKPIETDAAGNALSNSPETDEQRASRILGDPMRRVEMNTRDETPAHPVCRGCNQPLKAENAWISDGCPCNNPRGINHGLVPKECCTCDECSPQHAASSDVEQTYEQARADLTAAGISMTEFNKRLHKMIDKWETHWRRNAEQRDAEAEKYASGIPDNLKGFVALVEYACTVQRNSVLGGEPYVVVDVDGIIVATGLTAIEAMRRAIYKIETGEDVPDMEKLMQAKEANRTNTQLPADRESGAVQTRAAVNSHTTQPEVAVEQQASGVEGFQPEAGSRRTRRIPRIRT